MRIILANGTELNPNIVIGDSKYIQGTTRDILTFIFSDRSLDELDKLFTPANCAFIKIFDNEAVQDEEGNPHTVEVEYIHKNYQIRAELVKRKEEVQIATTESAAVYEDRIHVSMAQCTYNEMQTAAMQMAIEMLCMEDVEV